MDDDTPNDDPAATSPSAAAGATSPVEREHDLAILESLETELAEVEAALARLDGTDDGAEMHAHLDAQT
jgi:hypothetical protein